MWRERDAEGEERTGHGERNCMREGENEKFFKIFYLFVLYFIFVRLKE